MENKGKSSLVALVDEDGFCRPTRQRKKMQTYVAGRGEGGEEKEEENGEPLF
jgi:hypothetical protein